MGSKNSIFVVVIDNTYRDMCGVEDNRKMVSYFFCGELINKKFTGLCYAYDIGFEILPVINGEFTSYDYYEDDDIVDDDLRVFNSNIIYDYINFNSEELDGYDNYYGFLTEKGSELMGDETSYILYNGDDDIEGVVFPEMGKTSTKVIDWVKF